MSSAVSKMDKSNVPETILKRETERKERLAKKLEDEQTSGSQNISVAYFLDQFKNKKEYVEGLFEKAQATKDRGSLSEIFNEVNDEIQSMHKYLFNSSVFLRSYDIRVSKDTLQALSDRAQSLEERLMPRKKFGFKSKPKTLPTSSIEIISINKKEESHDTCDGISSINQYGFEKKDDEKLELKSEEVFERDVSLTDLNRCTVILQGTPNTILMNRITDCTVLCGPVITSILIYNCSNCILALAGQQLRIHKTINTRFFVHASTAPIIEDSSGLLFAPYLLSYAGLEEEMERTGLKSKSNCWDKVLDFNYLASNCQSPNWAVLPEEQRNLTCLEGFH